MGTNQDLIQRAEIRLVAVMSALGNGAGNALIHVVVHGITSFSEFLPSMSPK